MRSNLTPLFVAATLAAAVGSAAAHPATVAGPVHLHARPTARSAVIAVIPANTPVNTISCRAWCRVQYGDRIGFVQAPMVVAGAPAAVYGSADPGPLGLLTAPLTAPFDVLGGAVDGATYGYGAAVDGHDPVVAAY